MTQTAALTQEERAEIRALCERLMPEGWCVSEGTHLFRGTPCGRRR
jgi:hypothetical protein